MKENNPSVINSKILKSEDINWKELKFIQQDDFKELADEDKQRLKNSLIANHFIQPFYVWQDQDSTLYCLDGRHRTFLLHELVKEGAQVPEQLPAIFVDCKHKQEAAKMVLVFSSAYARVTEDGLREFLTDFNLSSYDIDFQISLPDIDLSKLYGNINKDFSSSNVELDIDAFTDAIVLKLTYSKADYLLVKQRISQLMEKKQISSPEELIKHLLQ